MRLRHIVFCVLLLAATPAVAQETLRASKVQARASRRQPSLGLPKRLDGQGDPVVWYDRGVWKGADSLKAEPFWNMTRVSIAYENGALTPVMKLCQDWASESPHKPVDVVWGPFRGGWFAAICKQTDSALGWKSIAFRIPPEGMSPGKSIYAYSKSVNWLEHFIGYDLFPKLPRKQQEIIEEITATELLCSFQEFDRGLEEGHDWEIDLDWESDIREHD